MFLLATATPSRADNHLMDVTLFVGGDLLEKGGVVTVYPLPVPELQWKDAVANHVNTLDQPADLAPLATGGKHVARVLTRQYQEVQFLYPEGYGNFVFRFKPHPLDTEKFAHVQNRLLTIGGIDSDTGLGEKMTTGFTSLSTSGTQIIQINIEALSEKKARALSGLQENVNPPTITCEMQTALAVCGYDDASWPAVTARWDKAYAALEKEYRRMKTLDDCYRGAEAEGKTGGTCHQISKDEEEAVYEYRDP